jgi:hypothetical protein
MGIVTKGYDFFETIHEDASFQFPTGLEIPAGFFHKHSEAFTGTIYVEGVPIRKFKDPGTGKEYNTGTADTVVQRKEDVTLQVNGSGKTPIELVRLSLRSRTPILVKSGRQWERWDVHVSLSQKPSTGTITITQTEEHGGTFSSVLQVWPTFRFVPVGGGAEKHLDLGALKIPDAKREFAERLNTLQAIEVTWQDSPPEDEDALVIPELTRSFVAAGTVIHYGPHPVRPPVKGTLPQ